MVTALPRDWVKGRTSCWPSRTLSAFVFNLVVLVLMSDANTTWARPQTNLQTYLQQRFNLSALQARGALGALLVYANQRLQKRDFEDLAAHVPNAEQMMVAAKQGIVTGPLDNIGEYERALASLEIGQPLASQIAPAVIEWLGAAGYSYERDILTAIVN